MANRYIKIARKLAMKARISIPKIYKRQVKKFDFTTIRTIVTKRKLIKNAKQPNRKRKTTTRNTRRFIPKQNNKGAKEKSYFKVERHHIFIFLMASVGVLEPVPSSLYIWRRRDRFFNMHF